MSDLEKVLTRTGDVNEALRLLAPEDRQTIWVPGEWPDLKVISFEPLKTSPYIFDEGEGDLYENEAQLLGHYRLDALQGSVIGDPHIIKIAGILAVREGHVGLYLKGAVVNTIIQNVLWTDDVLNF